MRAPRSVSSLPLAQGSTRMRVRKHTQDERRITGLRPEGGPMYARLISFSDATPERRESAMEMIRGTVIPMLRSYDGYAGYLSLYDEGNNRAKAILLW